MSVGKLPLPPQGQTPQRRVARSSHPGLDWMLTKSCSILTRSLSAGTCAGTMRFMAMRGQQATTRIPTHVKVHHSRRWLASLSLSSAGVMTAHQGHPGMKP
jgi:hypothetical protein